MCHAARGSLCVLASLVGCFFVRAAESTDPDQFEDKCIARAAERSGDLTAARDHSLAALDLLESVRRNAPPEGPRISFQAYKLPFYQEAVEILMAMHGQQPQAGFDVQALQISERARALVTSLGVLRGKVPRALVLAALRPAVDPLTRLLAEDEPGEAGETD